MTLFSANNSCKLLLSVTFCIFIFFFTKNSFGNGFFFLPSDIKNHFTEDVHNTVSLNSGGGIGQFEIIIPETNMDNLESDNYDFNFESFELWEKKNDLECAFKLTRQIIEDKKQSLLVSGTLKIENENIIFGEHKWKTGGMADSSYLIDDSNLKFTQDGSLVGTLTIFNLFVSRGEIANPPVIVELLGTQNSKKSDFGFEGYYIFDVDDYSTANFEIINCIGEIEGRAKIANSLSSEEVFNLFAFEDIFDGVRIIKNDIELPIAIGSTSNDFKVKSGKYAIRFIAQKDVSMLKVSSKLGQILRGEWSHKFSVNFGDDYTSMLPAKTSFFWVAGNNRKGRKLLFDFNLGNLFTPYKGLKKQIENGLVDYKYDKGGANFTFYDLNDAGQKKSVPIILKSDLKNGWVDIEIKANWSDGDDGYLKIFVNGEKKFEIFAPLFESSHQLEIGLGLTQSEADSFWLYKSLLSDNSELKNCAINELKKSDMTEGQIDRIFRGLEFNWIRPSMVYKLAKTPCMKLVERQSKHEQSIYFDEVQFTKK